MPKLFTDAALALQGSLRFHQARTTYLAANIANADTPHYRAVDLKFEDVLSGEQLRLARTHETHMHLGGSDNGYRLETGPPGEGPDGNGVDLDAELVKMKRNAGAYERQADILTRLITLTSSAIEGG